MTFNMDSIAKKLWLTITAAIVVTIIYSYFLSYLFYEKLYVENVEENLLEEGHRLAAEYEGGPLTDELKDRIDWYSSKSETEIFIVSNPRELSACLPFDIDYETLISGTEREKLLKGKPVQKIGYEERFDRKIMAVVIPLLDENRLEGIIYLYIPLAKISEVMTDFAYLWMIAGILFLVIAIFTGTMLVRKLTKPLIDMKDAAEKVSLGDYSVKITNDSMDEIGQLAQAFNHMASSIQKEDERKKEFLANVSHELRTPISYIKGYSDALHTGIIKEEDQSKYLSLIHREAGRMERLVGDLLDLSKLDSNEFKIEKTPLPLGQLIEDSVQKYILKMREKEIEFNYEVDPDIIINGDAGRIEQVLQNILDNSIRYTDKGRITLKMFKTYSGCSIEITDTGVGIPAEDMDKIKQRFFRVNRARTRKDGGTGLGLAIAEKLISLHGGTLNIDSQLGKGTMVQINLPVLDI
ncbi:sensor histidine kinase [Cytobacillus solani]|uniref:histidine kinase n=1 Tax=Cytobacillus solani TaxID=1637975 RepID=A0A0Q3VIN0_9BACI|nr:ATP-binding protein [Cytobacillus solani]KOP83075.1 histidine kinase [Bacillus sp. FJAT-21945]KQL20099.1 histidine kinase [Cytobacillus solani]USK53347.1 cell wall metabolism sensor histidine kinase WalK [Cytobacillus solani]